VVRGFRATARPHERRLPGDDVSNASRLADLTERARRTIAAASPPPSGGLSGPRDWSPGGVSEPGAASEPGLEARTAAGPPAASPEGLEWGELVLGVDPGTATTGYGLVRRPPGSSAGGVFEAAAYGVVETPPADAMPVRLLALYRGLVQVIREHRPAQVAVEQVFFGRNTTTAMSVGQARGVVLLAVAEAGLPVAEYTPLQVKRAIAGFGRAEKHQMQRMVQTLLGLPSVPKPDDAADALAIALCHLRLAHVRALGLSS
jgi:crossover junction endodeoxyribonuclease RuvC